MIKNIEITESIQLLSDNYIGRLAFISAGSPYVIPVTYHYNKTNNAIISYSGVGHKIQAMRKNNTVAFEVDEITSLSNWKSVLIQGVFEEIVGTDAKYILHEFAEGVKNNIHRKKQEEHKFLPEFSSKIKTNKAPIVYQIKIIEVTGKLRYI
ncbi:hypothetical protein GCM10022393_11020 [Aquimarina addita]|uniref:Flavin mononucleotide-binding protein n=1 Tax=Aquimarina addita TaxID=870485 RepID=A0ABP7XE48_9FLAO